LVGGFVIRVGNELVIGIDQYIHNEGDTEVHIFFGGFIPTYNPVTCIKGKPESMKELVGKLEDLLGVHIKVSEPSNADHN
jgi:hypothetical protein